MRKACSRAPSATTIPCSCSNTSGPTGSSKATCRDGDFTVPIGKAAIARPGKDLSIITYGLMRHMAVEAAETLAAEGIDVRSARFAQHTADG